MAVSTPSLLLSQAPNEGFSGTTDTFTVGSDTYRAVIAFIVGGFNATSPTAATLNGVSPDAFARLTNAEAGGVSIAGAVWLQPTAGSGRSIAWTGAADSSGVLVYGVTGAAPLAVSGVVSAGRSGIDPGTTHGQAVTSAVGSRVIAALACSGDPTALLTQLHEITTAYGNAHLNAQHADGAASVAAEWTTGSAQFGGWIGLSIDETGSAGPSVDIDQGASGRVDIGAELQLSATVDDEENEPPYDVEWSSSNESVATVNETGLVTTLAPGTTNIVAHYGSVDSDPFVLTVGALFVGMGAFSASTTGITPALPTGWDESADLAAGKTVALAFVVGRPTGTTQPTEPTGWPLIATALREVGANDLRINAYARRLQSGDTAPTFTAPTGWTGTSAGIAGAIGVWRGIDPDTMLDLAVVQGLNAAAAATWTPTGLSTETDGAVAISAVASADDNNLGLSAAQSFAARASGTPYHTTTGGDMALGVADRIVASAGAVTYPTWSQGSNGNDAWAGISLALRPAVHAGDVVEVTVDRVRHGHRAASPALTQQHVAAAEGVRHGHRAERPALTQAHVLIVSGVRHGHSAARPALTQAQQVAVAGVRHAHTVVEPALTQAHVIAAADARHAHSAGAPSLTQAHVVAPEGVRHAHRVAEPTLSAGNTLNVPGVRHAHVAQTMRLVQAHLLAVGRAVHRHTAATPALNLGFLLGVARTVHAHTAGRPELVQAHVLAVADAVHAHYAARPSLLQAHVLDVLDVLHRHTVAQPAIFEGEFVPLEVIEMTLSFARDLAMTLRLKAESDMQLTHTADIPLTLEF